jgi:general secretion pathway protein M
MSQTTPQQAVQAALQQAWTQRSRREKQLLGFGAATVMLTVLWSLALAPAWRTWQEAPAKQARLDAQTQSMLQLQAQAKSLQMPHPISRSESAEWLEKNVAELGPNAKISLQGESATLSLDAAPAEALASWISLARERALAMPVQAQLQQGSGPSLLRGTLVLRLP